MTMGTPCTVSIELIVDQYTLMINPVLKSLTALLLMDTFYDQDGVFVNLGTNRFVEIKGKWYYLNDSGQIIKGSHIINGAQVYFDENGIQIKGDFDKENRYYDEHTGKLVTNRFVTVKDKKLLYRRKRCPRERCYSY